MKRAAVFMAACGMVFLVAGVGHATERTAVAPTYEGQFGNPEEPALRPYKWMWSGVRAVCYQTRDAFVRGNMNTPVIGSVETLRGARKGTLELAESSFKGAVFAPIEPGRHQETHFLNRKVDEDLALRNISDAAVTWYLYPVLKCVDHCPLEDDEQVEERLVEAERIREARKEAEAVRREAAEARERSVGDSDSSRVRRAQKQYVGDRLPFSGTNGRAPARNLLKLSR